MNGESNIADLTTTGEKPEKLNLESEWQNGSAFLKLPIENWPIRQDCLTDSLPEQAEVVMHTGLNSENEIISSKRFSKFVKLMRVTAQELSVRKGNPYSFKRISYLISLKNMMKPFNIG